MELRERPYGDTIVVDVVGPVEREAGDTVRLVMALKRFVTQGYKVLVLNVANLQTVDSVLLGAIAQASTSAIRSGAALKLANVGSRLRELLAITKLDRVVPTVDSLDQELRGRR
jgi:anti-anti-sigma factor